jgi:hypothetical protein
MPGLIGASIFSPFAGLGYRFQSLQHEIIAIPSQRQAPQQFSSNQPVRRVSICAAI